MKVILIGFMGAGKTTVGRILAKKLGYNQVEIDDVVISKSVRKSVAEMFDKDGEITFRELELIATKELETIEDTVIITGGGIIRNQLNLDYLKKNSLIIYLKNSFATSQKRITETKTRPLFQDLTKAKKLYKLRQPLYETYADITLETDDKSADEVLNAILVELNKK